MRSAFPWGGRPEHIRSGFRQTAGAPDDMPFDPEIAQLLAVVDRAYDRRSWHGTNLRGSIRGLSAADAAWRPARGRHNVWEIVVHAAYWKYAVTRRLTQ